MGKDGAQTFKDLGMGWVWDPALHRSKKCGFYGWMKIARKTDGE